MGTLKTSYMLTLKMVSRTIRFNQNWNKGLKGAQQIATQNNNSLKVYKLNKNAPIPNRIVFLGSPENRTKILKGTDPDDTDLQKNQIPEVHDNLPDPLQYHALIVRQNPYCLGKKQILGHFSSKKSYVNYDGVTIKTQFIAEKSWSIPAPGRKHYSLYGVQYPESAIVDMNPSELSPYPEPQARSDEILNGKKCSKEETRNHEKFLSDLVQRGDALALKNHNLSVAYRQKSARQEADQKKRALVQNMITLNRMVTLILMTMIKYTMKLIRHCGLWLSNAWSNMKLFFKTLLSLNVYMYTLFSFFSLFIIYLIYIRLIMERLPLDILDPVTNFRLGIYVYILLINLVLLINLLFNKVKTYSKYESRSGKLAHKMNNLLFEYILMPISTAYLQIIYRTIPLVYERVLLAIFLLFDELPLIVKRIYYHVILFLPKLVVLTSFLIDVFVFEYFYYFYKYIWLLLIPLLVRFLYYTFTLLQQFASDRIIKELDASPCALFNDPTKDVIYDGITYIALKNPDSEEEAEEENKEAEEEYRKYTWYEKIYIPLKFHLKMFWRNVRPQPNEDQLYLYNLRTYPALSRFNYIIFDFDTIRDIIEFDVNFIIRVGYIIGWSAVIFHQGPFPTLYHILNNFYLIYFWIFVPIMIS